MGNPTGEYKPGTTGTVIWGVILTLLGLAACGFAAISLNGSSGAVVVAGFFGLLMLGGGGWQLYVAIRDHDLRVVTLEKGVVRVGGGKTLVLPWDDITLVYQAITDHYRNGIKTNTTHVYTIFRTDKTKIVFNDSIKKVENLGTTIQKETTARLMPGYAKAYNAGNPVKFGKLTLSKSGINNGKETIPWDQVDAVNINRGQISVRKQGKWLGWAGQSAAATPNLFVFLSLVDQIVGINKKK